MMQGTASVQPSQINVAKIGFMQGRLSPPVNGAIQSFPWPSWEQEFPLAAGLGFTLMEWTLDHDRLNDNPLMTSAGRTKITALTAQFGIRVSSLTADCCMQAPFWKAAGSQRNTLQNAFLDVARACGRARIGIVVVPLVDNGRIEGDRQEDTLVEFLTAQEALFRRLGLKIVLESDYTPMQLARLIGRLHPDLFGVSYDIGNSASLGFDPAEEFTAYGDRIANVHVKDRVKGGGTVPLGAGDADFDAVFSLLADVGYEGNYILQTARAADGDHVKALHRYREMTAGWLSRHAA